MAETPATHPETIPDLTDMIITEDFYRTSIRKTEPIVSGLDAGLYSIAGTFKRRPSIIRKILATAQQIDAAGAQWKKMSDSRLKSALSDFKEIFFRRKPGYEAALPDALGAIREAAERCTGMRPFMVQLAGALAMYKGYIAEMSTGEGKTLTAVMTAIIRGWSARPCHIITVNDYLARRDSEWLATLYRYCKVTVGCVVSEMAPEQRREGYARDVTYTTSKEIVADFLRDRLWLSSLQNARRRFIHSLTSGMHMFTRGTVMRGIHSAIIDEADSILIDEAVTPLIISRPQSNDTFTETCRIANDIAARLQEEIDYRIDNKYKDIELLPGSESHIGNSAFNEMPPLFHSPERRRELIKQALNARTFFHRDKQYILNDGKVVIVDEFTGRLMPQRTWRAGLHQMIEAKENLTVTPPSETLARLSFQRFFRFFNCLAGMTGTAREAAGELWHIYGLGVLRIPENRPCIRKIQHRRFFSDLSLKRAAIVDEIVQVNKSGRPVLIGTKSVKESELLADKLKELGLTFRVLNAVHHEEEARIILHAGEKGAITVATNMAGRGTDIKLGVKVDTLGGLHVIASECHESGRIDRQLFGRSARQGDPGSAGSFVSIDDELLVRYLPAHFRNVLRDLLMKKVPSARLLAEKALGWAQHSAQRHAYRSRKSVLKMDTWLDDSLSFTQGDIDS